MQHLDKNYVKKAIITHDSKNNPHSDDVSIVDEAESTDQSNHVNDGVDESNHNADHSDEVTETDDLDDAHDSDGADESEDDDGCDNPDGPNEAKELD